MLRNSLKISGSLKRQLLLYFVLVALVPAIIGGFAYYVNEQKKLTLNTIAVGSKIIAHSLEKMDSQIGQVNEFANWICRDRDLIAILHRSPAQAAVYDDQKKAVIDNLKAQFQYRPITEYVLSLFILGDNGLDIRNGKESSLIDISTVRQVFNLQDLSQKGSPMTWHGIQGNLTRISEHQQVIPFTHPIIDVRTGKAMGYLVVLFKANFFQKESVELLSRQGEQIYIMNQNGEVLAGHQASQTNSLFQDSLLTSELLANQDRPYFKTTVNGIPHLIISSYSPSSGLIMVDAIPDRQLAQQKFDLLRVAGLLLLSALALAYLLSVFLSSKFTRPISQMIGSVKQIAAGDFASHLPANNKNELGQLSQSISKMRDDLQKMLTESVQKEKEKRTIEIHLLQAQMNPHFLYNTLNSIKMMAAMQGARGIQNTIEALGKILRATLSNAEETVLLAQELELLDSYLHIQNVRYKGDIAFVKRIADDKLLACRIPKFVLQPIVENAIMHGIKVGTGGSHIDLIIKAHDNHLLIQVQDDGVGFSPAALAQVANTTKIPNYDELSDQPEIRELSGPSDHGIGIANVHRRIQIMYGSKYGLNINSRPGEKTTVTLDLPLVWGKNN